MKKAYKEQEEKEDGWRKKQNEDSTEGGRKAEAKQRKRKILLNFSVVSALSTCAWHIREKEK